MRKKIISLFLLTFAANLHGFIFDSPINPNLCHWRDEPGFVFGKDSMWWTISQKGPEVQRVSVTNDGTETVTRKCSEYDWDLGWRCLLGYRLGCDRGGLYAVYTCFSESATANLEEIPDLNGAPVTLKSRNDVDYQTLDVLVTNDWDIPCIGNIRPLFGFRALWLDQSFNTKFIGNNVAQNKVEDRVVLTQLDNFAAGLHGGAEYQFDLCGKFSAYLQLSGSLLEGHIKETEKLYDNLFPDNDIDAAEDVRIGDLIFELQNDCYRPVLGLHLGAGLTFESCFFNCAWLRWDLGYELHNWINISRPVSRLNSQATTLDDPPCGNMTIHGIVFRGTYFF